MPSLDELVRAHTDLVEDDVAWLQLLMADWQILADLSFADLVLWLPDREGKGYWAAGQMRPTTGPTALVDDVLGTFIPSVVAGCSTRPSSPAGWCARATPSGATTCRCGSRSSRYAAPAG